MAHVGHDQFGHFGRRRFGGGFYDYGLDCPYPSYASPYCTYPYY
jgi:hypothetical protein